MNLASIFSNFGIPQQLSQDIMLAFFIALISFVFGMFIGRYRLISILVNIYVSYSIVNVIPERFLTEYYYKVFIFWAIIVALTLASRRLFEIYITGSGSGFLWRIFVMSFLETVFLISVSLSLLPKKIALGYVSADAYNYLATEWARLAWMLIPLAFMFFIHKRINR